MRRLSGSLVLVGFAIGLAAATPAFADDASTCNNDTGEGALAACNRAIDSTKYSGETLAKLLTSRGVELKRKGQIDAAIADYTRAISIFPTNMFAFNNRANTRRDKGDIDGALADYAEAIRLDPDYTAAYINRALVHQRRNAFALARADFQAALTTPDKYPNSRGGKELARQKLKELEGK